MWITGYFGKVQCCGRSGRAGKYGNLADLDWQIMPIYGIGGNLDLFLAWYFPDQKWMEIAGKYGKYGNLHPSGDRKVEI